ncbi:MAG TPA: hypothetical protein VFL66_05800 [Gaiellaceae bacterium]|nr:hypothetical protein [Gaiellaceae bacterium]
MSLVHECGHPGCSTLTMGTLCLVHEQPEPTTPSQVVPRLAALPFVVAAAAGFVAAFLARARLHI